MLLTCSNITQISVFRILFIDQTQQHPTYTQFYHTIFSKQINKLVVTPNECDYGHFNFLKHTRLTSKQLIVNPFSPTKSANPKGIMFSIESLKLIVLSFRRNSFPSKGQVTQIIIFLFGLSIFVDFLLFLCCCLFHLLLLLGHGLGGSPNICTLIHCSHCHTPLC